MMRWTALLTLLGWAVTSCQYSDSGQFGTVEGAEKVESAEGIGGVEEAEEVDGAEGGAPTQPRADPTFNENAFPPTLPDTDWHRAGWIKNDCLRCHETGVQTAPRVVHRGMPEILLTAKCRTCHVLIPGSEPRGAKKAQEDTRFAANAFPPMLPRSSYHLDSWARADCLLCHESGIKGAPAVEHAGLPPILMSAKCRTCHVQRSPGDP